MFYKYFISYRHTTDLCTLELQIAFIRYFFNFNSWTPTKNARWRLF